MNPIPILARKDLLLLWRDPLAFFWMLGFPLVFAVFFGSIFSTGSSGPSRGIAVAVVEESVDGAPAEAFVERLERSDAVRIERMPRAEAADAVRRGRKVAYVELHSVPEAGFAMFAPTATGEAPTRIEVGLDPSRRAERGVLQGVLTEASFAGMQELFQDPSIGRREAEKALAAVRADEDAPLATRLVLETFYAALSNLYDAVDDETAAGDGEAAAAGSRSSAGTGGLAPDIEVVPVTRQRTGPPSAYSISFPQSLLWAIIGVVSGFAIALVRERTSGTMLRLVTAPIGRSTILLGTAAACFVSICGVCAVLLVFGAVVFGVAVDDVLLLACAVGASAACFTGIAMLLGTLGRTEQAVGGITWGVLITSAMLGGGMVPQIAMPDWMLQAGVVSPARWAIEALEGAIWRGYDLAEIAGPCIVLVAVGGVAFALGARRLARATA